MYSWGYFSFIAKYILISFRFYIFVVFISILGHKLYGCYGGVNASTFVNFWNI